MYWIWNAWGECTEGLRDGVAEGCRGKTYVDDGLVEGQHVVWGTAQLVDELRARDDDLPFAGGGDAECSSAVLDGRMINNDFSHTRECACKLTLSYPSCTISSECLIHLNAPQYERMGAVYPMAGICLYCSAQESVSGTIRVGGGASYL